MYDSIETPLLRAEQSTFTSAEKLRNAALAVFARLENRQKISFARLHKSGLSCVDGVCIARIKCVDCAVGQCSPVSGL